MFILRYTRPASIVLVAAACQAFAFGLPPVAHAAETDQYMTWDVTLSDCATALNAYLDEEIHAFVEKMNRRNDKVADAAELTEELYRHLFTGIQGSRLREWLETAEAVDRYPDNDVSEWEYLRKSVFRAPAFPFFLPMAQTVRVGEVYFGIDKIGHMFGFGRRYFQIYQRARDEGDSHQEAVDRVISWGIRGELSVVGKLVDGVFSNADLEANYQGLRLAFDFSAGDEPFFFQEDGTWRYRGGLDIREYINPDFDESFNTNDYAGWRARRVLPIVRAEYAEASERDVVASRFKRYERDYTPSHSKRFVEAWFSAGESDVADGNEMAENTPGAGTLWPEQESSR